MSSNDKLIELAKRMLNAFKHYECFVFEKEELENVKRVARESGIYKYAVLRKADPRYEYIYIILPWRMEIEQECVSRVQEALANRRINEETYKKYRAVMISQCIKHFERERTRVIVKLLEEYIKSKGVKGD